MISGRIQGKERFMKCTFKWVMALAVVVLLGATLRSPAPSDPGCPMCGKISPRIFKLMAR